MWANNQPRAPDPQNARNSIKSHKFCMGKLRLTKAAVGAAAQRCSTHWHFVDHIRYKGMFRLAHHAGLRSVLGRVQPIAAARK